MYFKKYDILNQDLSTFDMNTLKWVVCCVSFGIFPSHFSPRVAPDAAARCRQEKPADQTNQVINEDVSHQGWKYKSTARDSKQPPVEEWSLGGCDIRSIVKSISAGRDVSLYL